MTVHVPAPPPVLEPPWVPLAGWAAILLVLLGVWLGVVRLTSREPFDFGPFCAGYPAGVLFGLDLAGVDAVSSQAHVAGMVCPTGQATRGLDVAGSWCEGFAQGFLEVGEELGYGEPEEGPLLFVERMAAECVTNRVYEGLSEPVLGGGGGPAPADN